MLRFHGVNLGQIRFVKHLLRKVAQHCDNETAAPTTQCCVSKGRNYTYQLRPVSFVSKRHAAKTRFGLAVRNR